MQKKARQKFASTTEKVYAYGLGLQPSCFERTSWSGQRRITERWACTLNSWSAQPASPQRSENRFSPFLFDQRSNVPLFQVGFASFLSNFSRLDMSLDVSSRPTTKQLRTCKCTSSTHPDGFRRCSSRSSPFSSIHEDSRFSPCAR